MQSFTSGKIQGNPWVFIPIFVGLRSKMNRLFFILLTGFLVLGVVQPNFFPELMLNITGQNLSGNGLAEEREEDTVTLKKTTEDSKDFREHNAMPAFSQGILDPAKFEIAFHVTGYHRYLIDEPPEC